MADAAVAGLVEPAIPAGREGDGMTPTWRGDVGVHEPTPLVESSSDESGDELDDAKSDDGAGGYEVVSFDDLSAEEQIHRTFWL